MLLVDRNSSGLQATSERNPTEIFTCYKQYVGIPCPGSKSIHYTAKTNTLVYTQIFACYVPAYTCICIHTRIHTISCKFLPFAFTSRATLNRVCNIIEAPAGEAMIQPGSQKVNYTVGEGDDN